jgi:RNA polymerase sigma factor for flagellar operon FliA
MGTELRIELPQGLIPLGPRVAYRAVSLTRPALVDRQTSEAQFLENLPRIEKTVAALARRHGFRGAEADDLASWVKLRLIENDYAVFQKFRGESALTTYLTVVIATLVQDYKVQLWGRWRPSAAAQRKGRVAVKLEALVYRQSYTLADAAEVLRSSGDTTLSDRELASLLAELPRRGPPRPRTVNEDALAAEAGPSGADEIVENESAVTERTTIETALKSAMDALEPEDRCVLTMRFWQEMSVADIARALDIPQKPLYRSLQRVLDELRRALVTAGVSAERANALVGELES